MASSVSTPVKDPRRVKAGHAAAESRWRGMKALVRLDGLTPDQRKAAIEMVKAMREANSR